MNIGSIVYIICGSIYGLLTTKKMACVCVCECGDMFVANGGKIEMRSDAARVRFVNEEASVYSE